VESHRERVLSLIFSSPMVFLSLMLILLLGWVPPLDSFLSLAFVKFGKFHEWFLVLDGTIWLSHKIQTWLPNFITFHGCLKELFPIKANLVVVMVMNQMDCRMYWGKALVDIRVWLQYLERTYCKLMGKLIGQSWARLCFLTPGSVNFSIGTV